jgi:ATP-dependent DNA ligase
MPRPFGFIEPCLPTLSRTVPSGASWVYELRHDGFRFICRRDGDRARVFSRGGHDWSKQLPAIVAAMQALPVTSVTIDGEGVICGPDGRSDFDAMRAVFSRQGSGEAFLFAFDLLELETAAICATRHGRPAARPWQAFCTAPTPASGCLSTSKMPTARSCSGRRA